MLSPACLITSEWVSAVTHAQSCLTVLWRRPELLGRCGACTRKVLSMDYKINGKAPSSPLIHMQCAPTRCATATVTRGNVNVRFWLDAFDRMQRHRSRRCLKRQLGCIPILLQQSSSCIATVVATVTSRRTSMFLAQGDLKQGPRSCS